MTSVGGEAVSGVVATSERSDDAPAMASQHRADRDASEGIVRRSRTASPPIAVRAAEVALLQRWLARVWPAIALGGDEISGGGVAGVIAAGLVRPALATVTDVLLASSPTLLRSGDPPPGGHAHQGVASASRSASPPVPAPIAAEGGKVVYLITIAGLLALLAFTVWREFRVALHPRLR